MEEINPNIIWEKYSFRMKEVLKRINNWGGDVVVVLDSSFQTFRKELSPRYKSNRLGEEQIPFKQTLPVLRTLFDGFKIIEAPKGFEGDDVAATLADKAREFYEKTIIHTGDSDLLQLVDQETSVYMWTDKSWKNKNPTKHRLWNFKKQNYGLTPEQIPIMKALGGNTHSNIQGVISYKDANHLLREYQNYSEIVKNLSKLDLTLRVAIAENIDNINLNLKLTTLRKDLDIELPWMNKKQNKQQPQK